jgi:hypothetical protein
MSAAKNTDPDLLPCPFCGSGTYFSFGRDDEIVNVRCENWGVSCLGAGPNKSSPDAAAAAWNTRAASVKAGEVVAVRPLEWEKQNVDGTLWCTELSVCGEYRVRHEDDRWLATSPGRLIGIYKTCDDAKAAAQADYEARIRSALVVEPAPTASVGAMREALAWCVSEIELGNARSRSAFPVDPEKKRRFDEIKTLAAANQSDGGDLDARFKRLEAEATDLGYVLTPEPEHPDSPHAPQAVEAAWEPTDAQINSACLSFRHDYGLLDDHDRERLGFVAVEWLRAWQKEGFGCDRDEVIERCAAVVDQCNREGPYEAIASAKRIRALKSAAIRAAGEKS